MCDTLSNSSGSSQLTLTWVTDPHAPSIEPILQNILTELAKFTILNSNHQDLGSGRKHYEYFIDISRDIAGNPVLAVTLKNIQSNIDKIQYQPLTLSWSPSPQLLHEEVVKYRDNYINILKPLLTSITGYQIDIIGTTVYKNGDNQPVYSFAPLTNDDTPSGFGRSLYYSSDELGYFQNKADPEILMGYQLLTSDPLIVEVNNRFKSGQNLYLYENLFLVKSLDNNLKFDADMLLDKLRTEGYFAITDQMFSSDELGVIVEISELWSIKKIGEFYVDEWIQPSTGSTILGTTSDDVKRETKFLEHRLVVVFKTLVDFNMSPISWLTMALAAVQHDLLPQFTISYPQMMSIDLTVINRAKLQYAAILTMIQITYGNLLLIPFVSSIHVGDDFSITGMFTRYEDTREFLDKFIFYLNESQYWTVYPCGNDLNMSIAERWKLARDNKDLHPLLIPLSNGLTGEPTLYLVVDTTPYRNTPLARPVIDSNLLDEMTAELRDYFEQVCNGGNDPVSLEEINTMSLSQLMSLIITDDAPRYCFSFDTMKRLYRNDLNPVTKIPFSRKTITQLSLVSLGTYGLYQVGPVPGLFSDVPVAPLVKPKSGQVMVNTIEDTNNPNNIDPIKYVSIVYNDGTYLQLFDIYITDLQPQTLADRVQELWDAGWFLSPWGSALVQFISKVSLSPLREILTLAAASENQNRGQQAFEYLEQIKID